MMHAGYSSSSRGARWQRGSRPSAMPTVKLANFFACDVAKTSMNFLKKKTHPSESYRTHAATTLRFGHLEQCSI